VFIDPFQLINAMVLSTAIIFNSRQGVYPERKLLSNGSVYWPWPLV
jgi:hypothetical protein